MAVETAGDVSVVVLDGTEDRQQRNGNPGGHRGRGGAGSEDTPATTRTQQCEICLSFKTPEEFIQFSSCKHAFCLSCVRTVFESQVRESRVNVQCLKCAKSVQQGEIRRVLDPETYDKYLGFTLRQFLATQQPNVCYCLAPNCPYACINSCPDVPPGGELRNHFVCRREECLSEHCNRCKRAWHPDRTCEEFEREDVGVTELGLTESLRRAMDAKDCPTCCATIQKTTDGSCNQVICAVCQTSFCWLCGRRVTEMHFMRYVIAGFHLDI